ncbi:MAG: hypothetical protein K2L75_00825 [Muribaculaceae bacterium]|nr:hypothetical protein [Muribaculaceae bacterium]
MAALIMLSASCTHKLHVPAITYHSLRTEKNLDPLNVPDHTKIMVQYNLNKDQQLEVFVSNLTDEVMHIDQMSSFYIDPFGRSTSYYDPTVTTTSTISMQSTSSGIGVNAGAIGSFLGIRGPLSGLLNGINLSSGQSSGLAETLSTAKMDLPVVSLAPKSTIKMSKDFVVVNGFDEFSPKDFDYKTGPLKFSVCTSYFFEDESKKDKIVTNLYLSGFRKEVVRGTGNLNDALRRIYKDKPNCLFEPWYRIHFINNIAYEKSKIEFKIGIEHGKLVIIDSFISGQGLIDYK